MKDLLEYIVMNLASKPENVEIDEQGDNGNVNLTLTVDPSDMGLIIGKGGQTIHSIRKLLTVRAMAENVRVNLQLNEPQGVSSDKSQESSEEASAEEDENPKETGALDESQQTSEDNNS